MNFPEPQVIRSQDGTCAVKGCNKHAITRRVTPLVGHQIEYCAFCAVQAHLMFDKQEAAA